MSALRSFAHSTMLDEPVLRRHQLGASCVTVTRASATRHNLGPRYMYATAEATIFSPTHPPLEKTLHIVSLA